MNSIRTQLWTHLKILLIDSMDSTWTPSGLNVKKKEHYKRCIYRALKEIGIPGWYSCPAKLLR